MDMSWCIICDRRCDESTLYCSAQCRDNDANNQTRSDMRHTTQSSIGRTPPPSFVWTPTFHRSYSFRTQPSGGLRLNSEISSSNSITVI